MTREIKEIFDTLKKESGKIAKENILKTHSENELFKIILKFVYDPYVVTGLSDKKMNKNITSKHTVIFNNIEDLLKYIQENNTGKDIDVKNVQNYIEGSEFKEELYDIVTKKLNLGLGLKTLNKIFGKNFIKEFNCMLAYPYEKYQNKLKNKGFIISEKLDGTRALAFVKGNSVEIKSRNGLPMEGCDEICSELAQLSDGVYDGELLVQSDENLSAGELFAKTRCVVGKDGIKSGLDFLVFDYIDLDDFTNGVSKTTALERKLTISKMLQQHDFNYVKAVPVLYMGSDLDQIDYWDAWANSNGKEGVMINIADAPYECKRTSALLKVKRFKTCDLKVIDFEEGQGELSGTLGKLIVEYKSNRVGVGTGFSDEQRDEIWNNKEKYLEKIAEIKYFEECKNKDTDLFSLRFPVFICFRFDKEKESYN